MFFVQFIVYLEHLPNPKHILVLVPLVTHINHLYYMTNQAWKNDVIIIWKQISTKKFGRGKMHRIVKVRPLNRLDSETIRFWPIVPKTLCGHLIPLMSYWGIKNWACVLGTWRTGICSTFLCLWTASRLENVPRTVLEVSSWHPKL